MFGRGGILITIAACALAVSAAAQAPASTARSRPKRAATNIPKNRCRTTVAERMVETLAELPFIGDQVVCLSHDQAFKSTGRDDTAQVVYGWFTEGFDTQDLKDAKGLLDELGGA